MARLVFGMNPSLAAWPLLEGAIGGLKRERDREIEVAGPDRAHSLTALGLIDECRIYLHPVVLGRGKACFAGPRPPLRLITRDRMGGDVIRRTWVPAEAARQAPGAEGLRSEQPEGMAAAGCGRDCRRTGLATLAADARP